MNEPTKSRDVSALIALVNAMIEYWKEIARRNFVKAHPQAEPSEFERQWPKALANFLGVRLSQSDAERPVALGSAAKRNRDGRAQYYFSRSQRVPFGILLFH